MAHAGFSLVELVVVMAIMSILAAIFLSSGRTQQGERAVTNAAFDIAALIREAQAYGGGVKESTPSSGLYPPYGALAQPVSGTWVFKLFADENNNQKIDGTESVLGSYTLTGGITVQEFCFVGGSSPGCGASGNYSRLLVTFGPDTQDATIYHCNNGGNCNWQHTSAEIKLKTSDGTFARTVKVNSAGGVYVE